MCDRFLSSTTESQFYVIQYLPFNIGEFLLGQFFSLSFFIKFFKFIEKGCGILDIIVFDCCI
jgi:hypothetical protein